MYRIGQEEIDAVARVIRSGQLFKINDAGRECLQFEEEWKQRFGCRHALFMTSGFAALTSALVGLGVGPGDEVIVPAYTYIATALAVTAVGAIPVIADTDETLTLCADSAAQKITAHTKAILPVHIQGFPCDMDALTSLAKAHGIAVLEDACQADGGTYHGKPLGTIGDAGAYSFNYFKVLSCGEGGLLSTNESTVYERALIYHDASAVAFFGDQLDHVSESLFGGTEFRTSEITGAIMREQLKKLPDILRDLRRSKAALIAAVGRPLDLLPSHDADGGCATTLALRFGSEAECRAFLQRCRDAGTDAWTPIDTGKHVYTNWTQIMEKRGAFHPAMDPFRMAENRGLQTQYTPDMCAFTLRTLARTAYIAIDPDWDAQAIEARAAAIHNSI